VDDDGVEFELPEVVTGHWVSQRMAELRAELQPEDE
jgi:hypothetical protein